MLYPFEGWAHLGMVTVEIIELDLIVSVLIKTPDSNFHLILDKTVSQKPVEESTHSLTAIDGAISQIVQRLLAATA